MRLLKFTLSGKTAFFKKPDVNTYYYFTYGNIHRIALLGIFGAILGYGGYNKQKGNQELIYPEFYEKLRTMQIGIMPKNDKGYIPKKVQTFNNSVGYASKEQGGNLIIKEQWLEEPKWDIYVLIEDKISNELAERIINRKYQYIPYLGKNDHIANITDAQITDDAERTINVDKIDSLFLKEFFQLQPIEEDPFTLDSDYVSVYKYEEMLPITLEENTNKYELQPFLFTNSPVKATKESLVYTCNGNIIFFF